MKSKAILIVFLLSIFSNFLSANILNNFFQNIGQQLRTYKYICYETIGQGYHFSQSITRYSYEYCLNEADFNKSSQLDKNRNIYLPKAGVTDIKWHHCEDKVLGTYYGINKGQGKVEYSYPTFLNAFVPCWFTGVPPRFAAPPPKPLPQTAKSSLDIKELINNKEGEINKIYTGISGDQKTIKITSDSNTSLNNIQCKLQEGNNKENTINAVDMNKNFHMAFLSPTKSGDYTFYCTGKNDKQENIDSKKITFFVAPAIYNVDMRIDTALSSVSVSSGYVKTGNGTGTFNSSKDTHLKLSDQAKITINSKVITANGKPDTGINTSLKTHKIEFSNNGSTCPLNTIMASDTSKSLIKFNNGQAMVTKSISEMHGISFSDVGYGELKIAYRDEDTNKRIEQEKAKGNCGALVACPYAPVIEFNLKTRVFPDNYKVELVDGSNPIKVLYYGQGNDPKLESNKVIKVTALNANGSELKNNVSGCAALDVDLEVKSTQSKLAINLLNKDGATNNTIEANLFKTNSTASKDAILSVIKDNGDKFLPNEVNNPVFTKFENSKIEYKGKASDTSYPKYTNLNLPNNDMAVIRGRINLIDADNASDFSKMPTTKIIYEFYCQSCNLSKLSNITGVTKYENSPTAYNWYIDKTFSEFNKDKINNVNLDSSDTLSIRSVSIVDDGIQNINYNNASKGQYQVKVKQDSRASNSFPSYLLYNRYYDGTSSSLSNITSWGTSAKVLVYEKLGNDNRNYGLDTGNAKNTRGANRIGGL